MNYSWWSDAFRVLTIVGSIFALVGAIGYYAISKVLDRQKNEEIARLENDLVAVRDYADIAQLNLIGKPFIDTAIIWNSDLSSMLEGTYTIEGTYVTFKNDHESDQKFKAVIERYPRFPFAYYALAWSLRSKGKPEWVIYAHIAREKLEKTSLVSGHHPNHDQTLQQIKNALNQVP
jgi:hypothetical protein